MTNLPPLSDSIKIWSLNSPEWNFGDVISLILIEKLFYAFDVSSSDLRLVGSVISDGLVPPADGETNGEISNLDREPAVVYWGSGIREPGGLCEYNRERVEFLAVRGPVTASDLRLGSSIPMGDPGLFLPALYSPKINPKFAGKSICVPHYHDKRQDKILLEISGCDLVLRPNLNTDVQAIYEFIDALCSAKFVLTAALHAAVAAAAYEVPFCFWDNMHLDLPTKWQDFSELVSIEPAFAKNFSEGAKLYEQSIKKNITIPSLWEMIANSPFIIRESGLLEVLRYELRRCDPNSINDKIRSHIEFMHSKKLHFSNIEKKIKFFSKDKFSELNQEIIQERQQRSIIEASRSEIEIELQQSIAEGARYREGIERERAAQSAELDALRGQLNALTEALKFQEEDMERRDSEGAKRLASLDSEKSKAIAQINLLTAEFDEVNAGLRLRIDEMNRLKDDADLTATVWMDKHKDLLVHVEIGDQRIEELERLASDLSNERTELYDKINSLEGLVEDLSQERDAKSNHVLAWEERAREILSSLTASEKTLLATKNESEMLRDSLAVATREANALKLRELLRQDEEPSRSNELSRMERAEDILVEMQERRIAKSRSLIPRLLASAGVLTRNRHSRMDADARLIEEFLATLAMSVDGFSTEGRRKRILKYLMGLTDYLGDFPLFRNLEYLDMYPDVAASKLNPLVHYIKHGRFEGRNVHPLLDTEFYYQSYPESKFLAHSPAEHYLRWGAEKGYLPHPLFDTKAYFARYTDVGERRLNPLSHFLSAKRCTAHPLFDPNFYLSENPDVAFSGRNPLTHYLLFGWREGRDPHPLFHTKYYLSINTDVAQKNVNPLVHYVRYGAAEMRRASEAFDPDFYLAMYPDIAAGKQVPLVHYVEHGQREGRLALRPLGRLEPVDVIANQKPIVVMMDALFPRPDQDSGSLDQISFIKIFMSLGFDVHFIAILEFGGADFGDNKPYIALLQNMGVTCIRSDNYAFIEEYIFLNNNRIALFFNSRVDFGGAYIEVAQNLCPRAKVIFNTVDLHYVRQEREAILKDNSELFEAARATKRREVAFAETADAVVVVSESELQVLQADAPKAHPVMIPLIRDFEDLSMPALSERSGIAFVGGFLHQPNVDAVVNFLETTWPEIRQARPDITFYVIGANMPEKMQIRSDPGVEFVGYVADLADMLSKVRMTIAPLRYGAGAKGKLVSSLGQGVPSVVSTVAAEGMGLEHGRHVLMSELGSAFAHAIIELYDNDDLWHHLSQNGLKLIRRNYSIAQGVTLIDRVLTSIGVQMPAAHFENVA